MAARAAGGMTPKTSEHEHPKDVSSFGRNLQSHGKRRPRNAFPYPPALQTESPSNLALPSLHILRSSYTPPLPCASLSPDCDSMGDRRIHDRCFVTVYSRNTSRINCTFMR
jgi:hypothetical protein